MNYCIRMLALPVFLLVGLQSFAQTQNQQHADTTSPFKKTTRLSRKFPNHYHIFALSYGAMLPNSTGNELKANVPYTAVYGNGAEAELTFTGTARTGFAPRIRTIGGVFESIFSNTNDIVIGIGGFHNVDGDGGTYFHLGYRYVLSLGWVDLKPGMDFYFMSGSNHVGEIDNAGKDLYFKDFAAYSYWSVANTQTYTDEDGNEYDETTYTDYGANSVSVSYSRQATALQPMLAASTHWRRLSLSVEAGYMVQMGQNSRLTFTQVNDETKATHYVGDVSLRKNGSLSGPRLSVMIGYLL